MSETNNKSTEKKQIKIRFLLSPSARFLLPYNIGELVSLPEALALELIDTKFAEKA